MVMGQVEDRDPWECNCGCGMKKCGGRGLSVLIWCHEAQQAHARDGHMEDQSDYWM
jgi:hypothetical protein